MNEEEKDAIEKLTNGEKITLIELIRKMKREGIERFIVTRPEYVYIILNLIEKLQKENEELKKYKEYYSSAKQLVDSNYIHKQKVKDKIEELNKKILDAERFDERILKYRYQKQVLQELIEEREEK